MDNQNNIIEVYCQTCGDLVLNEVLVSYKKTYCGLECLREDPEIKRFPIIPYKILSSDEVLNRMRKGEITRYMEAKKTSPTQALTYQYQQ